VVDTGERALNRRAVPAMRDPMLVLRAMAFALLGALLAACPGDDAASPPDTATPDTSEDTAPPPDTAAAEDTGPADTTSPPADTTPPADTQGDDTSHPSDGADGGDDSQDASAEGPTFPMSCDDPSGCAVPCGEGACVEGRCVFASPQAGCVVVDVATDTGRCVDAGEASPDAACLFCNPQVEAVGHTGLAYTNDFDSGLPGMTVQRLAETVATWSVSSRRAASGGYSLYFGHPSEPTYDVGGRAAARAITPPLVVPEGVSLTLTFTLWLETEELPGYDFLRVLVLPPDSEEEVEVWHSDVLGGTTGGEFLPLSVPLTEHAAPGLRVAFEFDTVDGIINRFEGAYLDNLSVSTGCCARGRDCADSNACTIERCEAGTCVFDAEPGCCLVAGDCDDGDVCTHDACSGVGGTCSSTPIPGCCQTQADCNDDDPCTRDVCPGPGEQCRYQPLCCAGSGDCDDGDACTQGSCAGGQCHYVFACCEGPGDCDDGDPCTLDTCASGVCRHELMLIAGCCRHDVMTERFDSGPPADWAFDPPTNNVGWRIQATPNAPSGTSVLYYGHPTLLYYQTGSAPNSGAAVTAPIRLPVDVDARLTMKLLLDVEPAAERDVFRVEALVGGETIVLLTKAGLGVGAWQDVQVDVSWLAGQSVRLRFFFDTVDGQANNTLGVMIDDLRILSTCMPRACEDDVTCASPAPCITGQCVSGGCSYGGSC